ncbi:MAG: FAD-dependent oxidoreductase [bacterium]
MKIIILGGGLAGCSIGYQLANDGHNISVIEKSDDIGGICQTRELGGINYEFGPHILYAKRGSKEHEHFRKFFPNFNEKKYFPRLSIDGELDNLCFFPVTTTNILRLPHNEQVKAIEELYHINLDRPDFSNIENYIISRIGKTAYKYFFKNYNIKQWGIHPAQMDTEWCRFRNFYLRDEKHGMFGNAWQGHPGSYRGYFNQLSKNFNIITDEIIGTSLNNDSLSSVITSKGLIEGDFYISTIPIDLFLNKKDALDYRGIYKIFCLLKGKSGIPSYLLTFPNNYSFTRLMDYNQQADQSADNSLISMAFPHDAKDPALPLQKWHAEAKSFLLAKIKSEIIEYQSINQNYCYPLANKKNIDTFNNLLNQVSQLKNVITMGRLGLYAYISMCTIIKQSSIFYQMIEKFPNMTSQERFDFYNSVRSELI